MSLLKEYAPRCFNALVDGIAVPETRAVDVWSAEYQIVGFLANSAKYVDKVQLTHEGSLSLKCTKKSNRIITRVSHSNWAHPADQSQFNAEIKSEPNLLCTPVEWAWSQQFEKRPDPDQLNCTAGRGVVDHSAWFRNGKTAAPLTAGLSLTSDYTLFIAMRGLFQQKHWPQSFDMLETLSVVRRSQNLTPSGKVRLADGCLIHEFIQRGDGILLWFWWLDSNGIPVACIREHAALILKRFGEAV